MVVFRPREHERNFVEFSQVYPDQIWKNSTPNEIFPYLADLNQN